MLLLAGRCWFAIGCSFLGRSTRRIFPLRSSFLCDEFDFPFDGSHWSTPQSSTAVCTRGGGWWAVLRRLRGEHPPGLTDETYNDEGVGPLLCVRSAKRRRRKKKNLLRQLCMRQSTSSWGHTNFSVTSSAGVEEERTGVRTTRVRRSEDTDSSSRSA